MAIAGSAKHITQQHGNPPEKPLIYYVEMF